MNKILTLMVSIVVVGSLFTGCGKKEVKAPVEPTKVQEKANVVQATPKEVAKVKGDSELTYDQATAMANMEKNSPLVKAKTKEFAQIVYNLNLESQSKSDEAVKKVEVLSYSADLNKKFVDFLKMAKAQAKKIELVEFNTEKTGFKEFTTPTGVQFGCETTSNVTYKADGVVGEETLSLILFYDGKTNTWKIADFAMQAK